MTSTHKWKRLADNKEIALLDYLKKWILENPEHKLYIGCDSHNMASKTAFATVIVLHYSSGGGHVIYTKETLPRIKNRHERLWMEVQSSVETAMYLMENGIEKPNHIDVDLNPDPQYKSNSVLRAALGLIESIGIEPRYKTKSPWSISIADKTCR